MGSNPTNRVKLSMGKLDSMRASKERGSTVFNHSKQLFHKFMEQLEKIFKNLPKSLEWGSFYENDLPLVIDYCKDVQEASMQNGLNGAQTRALAKLKQHRTRNFKGLQLVTKDLQVGNRAC
jgi:hypothetical protein